LRGFVTDPSGRAGLRMADDLPEPRPGPDQMVLEVRAYSINPGEAILIRRRPNGWRPGQDVAGVVVQAAADGSGPAVGARVAARVDWEGWAERVTVPAWRWTVLDERVGFEQAATLPIAGLTALRSLRLGGSVLGRDVLVTGASGGVGQFAVQLAALSGARVTAHVRSAAAGREVLDRGARQAVTSLADPDLGPFHLMLDGVGGEVLVQALHRLAAEGTAVLYGGLGGAASVHISDFAQQAHNARVVGLVSEHPERTKGEDIGILAGLMAEGRLVPAIGWVRDWSQTPDAFEALTRREFRGNAVLLRS